MWNSRCDSLIVTGLRKSGKKGIKGEYIELFQNFAINKKKNGEKLQATWREKTSLFFYGRKFVYTHTYSHEYGPVSGEELLKKCP